jgi:hypothetical protein
MTKKELMKLKSKLEMLKELKEDGMPVDDKINDIKKQIEIAEMQGTYGVKLQVNDANADNGGTYDVLLTTILKDGSKKDIVIKENVKKHYSYQIRNILSLFFSSFLESNITIKANGIQVLDNNVTKNK